MASSTYTAPMRIEVLVFGPVAEVVGADRIGVECHVSANDSGPSVATVLEAIGRDHPELATALPGARLAVNHAFAPPEALVGPGDEVALIALVGGG